MYSNEILGLSNFLTRDLVDGDAIAQHLVVNTFSQMKATTIYIGQLHETGEVRLAGGFGWSENDYVTLPKFYLQDDFPITEAIRKNLTLVHLNDESFRSSYPLITPLKLEASWFTLISIPIYAFGGFSILFSRSVVVGKELNIFLMAISSLLALHFSHRSKTIEDSSITKDKISNSSAESLTVRQVLIVNLIKRGFNNAQIGLDLGYSESLIRQETIVIYRQLQVSGRKEIQDLPIS